MMCSKRKEPVFRLVLSLYVCITYLSGQANVLSCRNNRPVDGYRQKNLLPLQEASYVGITYLPGQSPAKYCRRT